MTDYEENAKYFRALAEPSRLKILAALVEKPMYLELLAERLNLAASTTSFHLKKLEEAGIIKSERDQFYTMYQLIPEALQVQVLNLVRQPESAMEAQNAQDKAYRQKVLSTFFVDGKLVKIPVQLKKRMIVLEELASKFEPGQPYPEKQVNLILADYNDDFCTLRREMIGEGLLTRQDGVYVRPKVD
ncbi:MAG TPA: metalloregulator ArsR/SmtB family transcription factor [Anaerolineaceae bacterium]|nr:metalloregulator ArsR/SmtB family transcription factor [Anaerolineaceae bacterium]